MVFVAKATVITAQDGNQGTRRKNKNGKQKTHLCEDCFSTFDFLPHSPALIFRLIREIYFYMLCVYLSNCGCGKGERCTLESVHYCKWNPNSSYLFRFKLGYFVFLLRSFLVLQMLIGSFSNIHGNLCSFPFHIFSKPFTLFFMCSNYSFTFSIIYVHLFQNLKFSPICFSWLSFLFILRHCSCFPLHLDLWLCVDHFNIYLCRACLSTSTVLLGAVAVQNSSEVIWQLELFWTFQNIRTQVVSLHGGWFNSSFCFHRECITWHYSLILELSESPVWAPGFLFTFLLPWVVLRTSPNLLRFAK